MWRTSHGDRVLMDGEAKVFLEAVGYLRDMITVAVDLNEPYVTGVTMFDSLQSTQQLMALHCVAIALIKPEVAPPELSATLEATAYAVYRELLSLIQLEVDSSDDSPSAVRIRSAVIAGCQATIVSDCDWSDFDRENIDLPIPACDDLNQWESCVESLANQVLWDRDFELEQLLADKDPAKTAAIKQYLGISANYFATAAPDAMSDEFRRIDNELVALRNEFSDE